jgi:hypothetical protein
VFTAEKPIANPGGTILTFYLKQNHGGWNSDDNQNHNLGRLRLSITTAPGAVADPLPTSVREILAIPRAERSPAQVQTVFGYWRTTVPEWQQDNARIAEIWREHPEGTSQLVLNTRADPRETHILTRGDFLKPQAGDSGRAVISESSACRCAPTPDFARWLVDRNAPTTARAGEPRLADLFRHRPGCDQRGFGKQSEAPSHPELLDWLASNAWIAAGA